MTQAMRCNIIHVPYQPNMVGQSHSGYTQRLGMEREEEEQSQGVSRDA